MSKTILIVDETVHILHRIVLGKVYSTEKLSALDGIYSDVDDLYTDLDENNIEVLRDIEINNDGDTTLEDNFVGDAND